MSSSRIGQNSNMSALNNNNILDHAILNSFFTTFQGVFVYHLNVSDAFIILSITIQFVGAKSMAINGTEYPSRDQVRQVLLHNTNLIYLILYAVNLFCSWSKCYIKLIKIRLMSRLSLA